MELDVGRLGRRQAVLQRLRVANKGCNRSYSKRSGGPPTSCSPQLRSTVLYKSGAVQELQVYSVLHRDHRAAYTGHRA